MAKLNKSPVRNTMDPSSLTPPVTARPWKLSHNRADEVLFIAGMIAGDAMRLRSGEVQESIERHPDLTQTNAQILKAVGDFREALEKIRG